MLYLLVQFCKRETVLLVDNFEQTIVVQVKWRNRQGPTRPSDAQRWTLLVQVHPRGWTEGREGGGVKTKKVPSPKSSVAVLSALLCNSGFDE